LFAGAPSEWTRLSRALPTQQLDLHFLLRQRNLPELEAALFAVSDPSSAEYGQHWTLEEVNDLVAPSEQHVSQVLQWLRSHGVSSRAVASTPNSDMMRVRVTVEQAEAMLRTEYFEFAHNERKDVQIVRTLRYHVPDYLAEAIDVVGPTVRFPSQATVRAARGAEFYAAEARKHAAKMGLSFPSAGAPLADCTTSGTTPLCLRALYSVNDYVASTNTTMAATGFLEQYISPTDLSSFLTQFDPAHARTAAIVGPNVASQPGQSRTQLTHCNCCNRIRVAALFGSAISSRSARRR
jgi:tripeptidyl-peptidase-1